MHPGVGFWDGGEGDLNEVTLFTDSGNNTDIYVAIFGAGGGF